ncbi:MAG: S-layer homology domain-containing protein [Clostridiaceae bacterium]
MHNKSKFNLIAIVLLICNILLSMPVMAETSSLPEITDTLNKLNILRGNNGDYFPEDKLKRSEAAAFIVRMMGKENHVLANKATYSVTAFPDVKITDWFAPYVGYCSKNGIIVGYTTGEFGPEDFINERSFLKMLLVCLGYTYGEDFIWSDVYKTAYITGLMKDASYNIKTDDNSTYVRGEVFVALYNALTLENKVTNSKLIQMLINEGAISKEIAMSTGLLIDSIKTAILSVTSLNSNTVSIKFNEPIEKLENEDVIISEYADYSKKLTVSLTSQIPGEIVITTSGQTADREYAVEITGVIDLEGNKSEKFTETFKGYRAAELKSDFLRISKVVPISNKVINLYFTHPITPNSEVPSYYEILVDNTSFIMGNTKSMVVKRIGSVNNGVTIYLKDAELTAGYDYTLKVNGDFSSIYAVKLNDGIGESISFKGIESSNEPLKVVTVQPLNSTSIEVEFNREVDPAFAEKFLNYTIIGANNINIPVTKAVLVNNGDKCGRAVLLTLQSQLDKTKAYEIRFEYLPDLFRETFLEGEVYSFDGLYGAKTNLSIEYVAALDKGTVQIYLSKPLNPAFASTNVYYMVTGTSGTSYLAVPQKASYQEIDGEYRVKLFMPSDKPLSGSGNYIVRVLSSMQDASGNTSTANAEYTFAGSSNEIQKTAITNATIIARDTIRVTFNRDIAYEAPNILTSNYSLQYDMNGALITKEPMGVTYISSTIIALRFDSLDYDTKYALKFNALKDISGVINEGLPDKNSVDVILGK